MPEISPYIVLWKRVHACKRDEVRVEECQSLQDARAREKVLHELSYVNKDSIAIFQKHV